MGGVFGREEDSDLPRGSGKKESSILTESWCMTEHGWALFLGGWCSEFCGL